MLASDHAVDEACWNARWKDTLSQKERIDSQVHSDAGMSEVLVGIETDCDYVEEPWHH